MLLLLFFSAYVLFLSRSFSFFYVCMVETSEEKKNRRNMLMEKLNTAYCKDKLRQVRNFLLYVYKVLVDIRSDLLKYNYQSTIGTKENSLDISDP